MEMIKETTSINAREAHGTSNINGISVITAN